MRLSPDEIVFWQSGIFKLNATIVFTWGLMLALTLGAKLITRRLSTNLDRSRWQNLLEIIVTAIEKQIEEVGLGQPRKYLGFLGTLLLFVAAAGNFGVDARRTFPAAYPNVIAVGATNFDGELADVSDALRQVERLL